MGGTFRGILSGEDFIWKHFFQGRVLRMDFRGGILDSEILTYIGNSPQPHPVSKFAFYIPVIRTNIKTGQTHVNIIQMGLIFFSNGFVSIATNY